MPTNAFNDHVFLLLFVLKTKPDILVSLMQTSAETTNSWNIAYGFMREKFFAETKIRQNYVAFGIEQNIFQFNITINNAKLQRQKRKLIGLLRLVSYFMQMLESENDFPDVYSNFVLTEVIPLV